MRNIRQEIQEVLRKIEKQEGVRILHAVESGSRAWGFASPDSDYDVRFIYVRPAGDYLRLDEIRDVIEWQMDEVLDINGWDLRKALRQFARGNATLFEWSGSPEIYKTTRDWEDIRQVSGSYFSEKAALYHYYGTARNTYEEYLCGELVSYKKYFYALRPLLAAVYIERFHTIPPVAFSELLQSLHQEELEPVIAELLERKRVTKEKERNPHMPEILRFIQTELSRQKQIAASLPDDHNRDWTELNACFRRVVGI